MEQRGFTVFWIYIQPASSCSPAVGHRLMRGLSCVLGSVEGAHIPGCTISSLGNAVQCCVVWVQLMRKERTRLPWDSVVFSSFFNTDFCSSDYWNWTNKLKGMMKRLHGWVLVLNSKNRLFNTSLWSFKAIDVSLGIASCLRETYSLCIFWPNDSHARFNQILQNIQFPDSKKKILNFEYHT